MPVWLNYALLGVAAGPVVTAAGACAARYEPVLWHHILRVGWRVALAASGLLGVLLVTVADRHPAVAGALAWLVITGLLLSLIDWASHRLPQVVVGLLLGGGVLEFGVAALVLPDGAKRLLHAAVALALVFVFSLTMALISPGGWGAGDVTLSASVAFFLGWFSWLHVILGLCLAFAFGGAAFGLLRMTRAYRRGMVIPFGPALISASISTILLL